MNKSAVNFFSEDIDYEPKNPRYLKSWIKTSAELERFKIREVNFIFCSDDYLLGLNQTYLASTSYTDIITFDHSNIAGTLEGDVFISYERVVENSETFGERTEDEIHRVMIHGILHLCGYKDKNEKEKLKMREKEDFYLSKRSFI